MCVRVPINWRSLCVWRTEPSPVWLGIAFYAAGSIPAWTTNLNRIENTMEKIQELRFDSPKAVEQIKWEPAEVLPVQQINLASIERMPERKLEKVIPIKV